MFLFESFSHPLGQALADQCRDAGFRAEDAQDHGGIDAALAALGAPRALILTPPMLCETAELKRALADPDLIPAYAARVQADAMGFLRACRAATLAMMPQKGGQVLFLGVDDVAARIIGLPETPIGNQLRVSGLKSLAKEYGRMGIKYNTIISQPARDAASPEVWRDRRDALKVYTMRFTPAETRDYAAFCWSVLINDVPLNGGIICLGKGVMEMAA